MKNLTTLLFAIIILASCGKNDDLNLDEIQGRWFVFSEQRDVSNGTIMIDTINDREEYFEFRADKTFLSTVDGFGFYEITRDSVHINFRRYDDEDYRRFGFQYRISGNDLALSEGNTTLNMKRL